MTDQERAAQAALVAEARAAGVNEGKTAAEAEAAQRLTEAQAAAKTATETAAKAAHDRVVSILGSDEAKGREALAKQLASMSQISAEDAIATLKAAPKADSKVTNLLAANMPPNPSVAADTGTGDGDDTVDATVTRIMNAGKAPKLAAVK